MGSSGETSEKSIDASVGTLVWVRRRNGSWWPGRIMGLDELPDSCVVSPKSGTPVKLLGRDDASVDWYNLERSKRVKAFRCGEYDECIEKAKAHAASGNKKKVKYARREDAIIHALEIENAHLGKDDLNFSARMSNSGGDHGCAARESPAMSLCSEENEDMVDDVSDSEDNSHSGPELSQSGISFEEPNHISSSKLQSLQGKRRKTPNDSEDDGTEGVKRMRGLEDLGMGVLSKKSGQTGGLLEQVQQDGASLLDSNTRNGMPNGSPANGSKGTSSLKRKRSQVANVNELLKRKNRSRPLTKVLESTAMVSIPAMPDQLPNSCGSPLQGLSNGRVSGLESNESKGSLSADHTGILCENGTSINVPELASGASSINDKLKENEIPSISGLAEYDSSDDRLFDVPFVGEEKDPSGSSPIRTACSSGKPQIGALGRQSSQSRQPEAVSLKNERINEYGCTSSAALHDISISMVKGSSEWQLKGKRNSRQTSKDRKHDSRRFMDMDDEYNGYSAGIEHSNGLSQGSYQKVNCNGISGSRAYNGTLRSKSKQVTELPDGPTQRSLPYRQSRFTVPARYQTADSTARNSCSDGSLYDVKLEVKSNYRPQHVPLVSLMSKLNSKAIVGHPRTVEVLDDGCSDWEVDKTGYAVKPEKEIGRIPAKVLAVQPRNSPSRSPKTKKSGLQPKKIRKLSSLTGHKQSEDRKPLVPKPKGPVIACIPLKLVFSRINEAVNGLARPSHRVKLQNQLLCDILKPANIEVSSVDQGTKEIQKRLGGIKVLVIIDDIDSVDQLEELAIKHDSFGRGSRIIVTTRDEQLLKFIRVDKTCLAQTMNNEEALQLLSWRAFRKSHPNDDEYLELANKVVDYCRGLPLALEVLGSYLSSKTKREWRSALRKLKRKPHGKIYEKLKMSYDGLIDDDVKAIFLDISCFFIGMNKDYVMTILDGCDFDPDIGIGELHDRCLVTVDEGNNLIMHDLLRDMGREIVRAKSPTITGKRCRLWDQDDVKDVLSNISGTEDVEGLTLDLHESDKPSFSTEALREMRRLRLLMLKGVKFTGNCTYLSKKLTWLCWPEFPLEVMPEDFNLPNLVDVDLSHSQMLVWTDSDVVPHNFNQPIDSFFQVL